MGKPTPEQIRAYARRDWAAANRPLDTRGEPLEAALARSQMLWEHMRALDPSWPTEAQRQADLEHHRAYAELVQCINDAGFPR